VIHLLEHGMNRMVDPQRPLVEECENMFNVYLKDKVQRSMQIKHKIIACF